MNEISHRLTTLRGTLPASQPQDHVETHSLEEPRDRIHVHGRSREKRPPAARASPRIPPKPRSRPPANLHSRRVRLDTVQDAHSAPLPRTPVAPTPAPTLALDVVAAVPRRRDVPSPQRYFHRTPKRLAAPAAPSPRRRRPSAPATRSSRPTTSSSGAIQHSISTSCVRVTPPGSSTHPRGDRPRQIRSFDTLPGDGDKGEKFAPRRVDRNRRHLRSHPGKDDHASVTTRRGDAQTRLGAEGVALEPEPPAGKTRAAPVLFRVRRRFVESTRAPFVSIQPVARPCAMVI